MDYINREFLVFSVLELQLVDFREVLETSADTVRKSSDQSKTFVKWEGESIPPSLLSLTTSEGPYTYEEILVILQTEEWTSALQNVI